ncbi:tetratricopeptide repeat protein [Nonomuraea sp. NPDC050328]|uniref:tetratricopeptide repeat protein n=1 Tax=Nonomuraea sp. NPDC050328 TaxID=3364361 RepID=UPI0037ACF502
MTSPSAGEPPGEAGQPAGGDLVSGPWSQSVLNSVVFGDLVQIANVSGNVTLTLLPQPERGPVVVGDIPEQPLGFLVREELLARLHARAGADGAAVLTAVTGTPGVGKTLLAASYAWACQHANWPVIVWITAESGDQIVTGLAALAQHLGLRRQDEDALSAAGKAKAWLSTCSTAGLPGLLVFDNAAHVADIAAWRPATGAIRVLITSRNRAFHQRYAAVEVDTFTTGQAVAYLSERTGLDDQAGAEALAAELGCLPLALAQAGSYIAHRRLTYTAYRRLLAAFPLRDYLPAGAHDAYPHGTAKAILLSVVAAEDAGSEAAGLLGLLAVLSPAGVPLTLLTGGADPDDPGLPADVLAALAAFQGVLAGLADTSLITFTEDRATVVMHRLVQRAIRERAVHDGLLGTAVDDALTVLEAFNERIPDGAATWAARTAVETLLEQTEALRALTAPAGPPTRLLTLRLWCGRYLTDLADLGRAIALYEQTLADRKRVLGDDHPDTLASRNNLAHAYQAAGDLGRAIALFEQTLLDSVRVLGGDHPFTLNSRNNLAAAYQTAGDLGRAIPLHEATLADRKRVLGSDHPDTLTSRNNLAHAYETAGDLGRAIPLHEATLADRKRVLGDDHPDTLTSRNNLAAAYETAGDLGRAIPLHEATLADRKRVLGDDHPDTLASRNNLAAAYQTAGDLGRAIPLHEQTLAERERVLGGDHPDTLASRNNLAYAYQTAGDLGRAIPRFEQTLAERERVLGSDHPSTLNSRNNLSGAYQAAGDLGRAIPLYEQTLAERERVLGSDHPDTLSSRNNLAGAYDTAGDLGRAIPLYEQTLAERERVLGGDHPDTLTSRNNLAYAYQTAGDLRRAIPLYEQTLTDCLRVLGPDHPLTQIVSGNLSRVRRGDGPALPSSGSAARGGVVPGDVERNRVCGCGSGKKFKRCHGAPSAG